MSPRVLVLLLGVCMLLQYRVEGPQAKSEKGISGSSDDFYGPKTRNKKITPPTKGTKTPVTGHRVSKGTEASQILNTILNNYDHKLRPGIGEKPTVVTVQFSVNSLGPLSTLDMEYTIDIIFYQTWYDERLRYNGTFETLVLNSKVVSQLWIPDTFFRNSKRTQEHTITMPNQMVRIHRDGKVLYTIRMTIDAGCTLHMHRFPMDSHSCPLSFSSFSYPMNEMIYKWEDFKLEINNDNSWKLFQFEFKGMSNKTETLSTPAGDFMVMTFIFNISRQFGYVTFQNYVPSSVTTMLSWVSFWIKKDSAAARTSLGVTSVLTMTTLGTFSRKNFPPVSYVTALDFYLAICFVFCFCALTEFAVLNFLMYNKMKTQASPNLRHSRFRARAQARARAHARKLRKAPVCTIINMEGNDGAGESSHPGSSQRSKPICCKWLKGCKNYFCVIPNCKGSTWQQGHVCIHIYRLDDYSRYFFPLAFFFFNVFYWLVFLYF
ncbi:PREDICTED: gamma-aminobutyric acid receptor subunit epsilon [Chrysochloris asiatica]|uniref:Gamma-aminobutyric acid receptor subunit epsilon n=1 Tax=Chrysochloris asiatica TaxID=185453 RepID=A0A9B0U7D9_CHRAS|nr:PREDICTED: gamma-aminobutyric acid receptor subunit epsilon [Chrysochloris asiatica]